MTWEDEIKKAVIRFYNSNAKSANDSATQELQSTPNGRQIYDKALRELMATQPVIYEHNIQEAKRLALGES